MLSGQGSLLGEGRHPVLPGTMPAPSLRGCCETVLGQGQQGFDLPSTPWGPTDPQPHFDRRLRVDGAGKESRIRGCLGNPRSQWKLPPDPLTFTSESTLQRKVRRELQQQAAPPPDRTGQRASLPTPPHLIRLPPSLRFPCSPLSLSRLSLPLPRK